MDKLQWAKNKICNKEILVQRVNAWRAVGKKIVFTNGCFDILHHGHIDYLAKAAGMGQILVIGLNTDISVKKLKGAARPINREEDRALQLASLIFVDAICLFEEETPIDLIKAVNPDVLVKGGDYSLVNIVGADFILSQEGQVEVIPFVKGYSTTSMLERIKKL